MRAGTCPFPPAHDHDRTGRTIRFAIGFDYLCPFARNAHEHVIAGLRGGAGWQVRFVPFSLPQVHLEEDVPVLHEFKQTDLPQ